MQLKDLFYFKQFNLAQVNKIKCFQELQYITKNSIKHQSFVYTQLNDQTVLFQTLQFSISHLFAHSLNALPICIRQPTGLIEFEDVNNITRNMTAQLPIIKKSFRSTLIN